MTGVKWSRRTPEKISKELRKLKISVSERTVGRLLKQMGFSLRVNRKSISHANDPDRNEQFEYIAYLRKNYAQAGHPIISVDTKKKELVGLYENSGDTWEKEAQEVYDHDFASYSEGKAIPYGIYEVLLNRGMVFVGTSCETAEFAAESIAQWWQYASKDYKETKKLLILADGGGGNGSRVRAWKAFVQSRIVDPFGLTVTICHYPPGTSKWNPIEHRLFSEISKNWKGKPLDSYETVTKYIRKTTTVTGLRVRARLVRKTYKKGIKISVDDFSKLSIERHDTLPKWNYNISPRNVN